jgi:endonuclease/exonuclease/phosphatase family metal-dependent hydrolase
MTGVRLATYNLLHGLDLRRGTVDLDATAAAIAALDADVVAVQEVDRGLPRSGGVDQVAELAARLGGTGVFAPALLGDPTRSWERGPGAGPDPGGPAYGIGLISRLPMTAPTVTALPGGGPGRARLPMPHRDGEPRAALRVTVAAPWGPLSVTTAHLSFVPWQGRRQLAAVDAVARNGTAAVLLGDLNLLPRTVGTALRPSGWRTATAGPTFPSWRPLTQIDHLLVHGDVTLSDVRVGPTGPSDHLPLSGTLRPTEGG